MNCRKFERIVADFGRPDGLAGSRKEEALRHAAECESCAWLLSRHNALSHACVAVREAETPSPAAMEERLLLAFRKQAGQRSNQPVRRPWFRAFWPVPVVAASLAAALILLYTAWPWQSPESPNMSPVLIQQAETVSESPEITASREEASVEPELPAQAQLEEPAPATPPLEEAPVAAELADPAMDLDEPQYLTDFIPTMYLGAADSAHEVQLVQVRLPRSSLASFGFAVDPRRLEEPVKADLLVGTDGLTRAIRFVVDDY
jgi:hypothetical protein